MQFLYAVKSLEQAKKLDRTLGSGATQVSTTSGPGDEPCIIFTQGGAKQCKYKPDEQTWVKSNDGEYWLGWWTASPPTAAELARKKQISGHKVTLGDGGEWNIPLARVFPIGTKLPTALIMGPGNVLTPEMLPQYVEFSSKCEALWDDFLVQIEWKTADEVEDMTPEDTWWICCEALALNYRVGVDEINALRLLTQDGLWDTANAVVDVPTFNEWLLGLRDTEKKKPQPAHDDDAAVDDEAAA